MCRGSTRCVPVTATLRTRLYRYYALPLRRRLGSRLRLPYLPFTYRTFTGLVTFAHSWLVTFYPLRIAVAGSHRRTFAAAHGYLTAPFVTAFGYLRYHTGYLLHPLHVVHTPATGSVAARAARTVWLHTRAFAGYRVRAFAGSPRFTRLPHAGYGCYVYVPTAFCYAHAPHIHHCPISHYCTVLQLVTFTHGLFTTHTFWVRQLPRFHLHRITRLRLICLYHTHGSPIHAVHARFNTFRFCRIPTCRYRTAWFTVLYIAVPTAPAQLPFWIAFWLRLRIHRARFGRSWLHAHTTHFGLLRILHCRFWFTRLHTPRLPVVTTPLYAFTFATVYPVLALRLLPLLLPPYRLPTPRFYTFTPSPVTGWLVHTFWFVIYGSLVAFSLYCCCRLVLLHRGYTFTLPTCGCLPPGLPCGWLHWFAPVHVATHTFGYIAGSVTRLRSVIHTVPIHLPPWFAVTRFTAGLRCHGYRFTTHARLLPHRLCVGYCTLRGLRLGSGYALPGYWLLRSRSTGLHTTVAVLPPAVHLQLVIYGWFTFALPVGY